MGKLAGKKIVVTGGTRGVGFELVRLLAAQDAEIVLTGRKVAGVERALESLGRPANVTGHAADVCNEGAMATIIGSGCDILVNNAAVGGPFTLIHESAPEAIRHCLEIDLVAPLLAARLAVIGMLESGGGTIVNVSSGAAKAAVPRAGPYCIAKAGLLTATRCLHAEYGDSGIRVFGFAPGIVDTDMQAELQASGLPKETLPPADKLLAPEQPAQVIAWLCAEEAADRFLGDDVDIYDPELQVAAGLSFPAPW